MASDVAMEETQESPIPIVVERMVSIKRDKNHMVEIVDSIERQIDGLRTQVSILEEEKDGIVTALDTLRQSTYMEALMEDEREEVLLNLDRLNVRVASVEIALRTVRDPLQEEALSEVNNLINGLIRDIEADALNAKTQCLRFLNTCGAEPEEDGPIDKVFETALLGCTLDDQKRVHKRLSGLFNYLQQFGVSLM